MPDGYFYLVDRIKDLIIVNGMNVYPRVIEEVLYAHPAVAEAAVVGDPDPRHGEVPVAHLALKPGASASAAELRTGVGSDWVATRYRAASSSARPCRATPPGKILKRELRRTGEVERGVSPVVEPECLRFGPRRVGGLY